jgi:hypothetical protein
MRSVRSIVLASTLSSVLSFSSNAGAGSHGVIPIEPATDARFDARVTARDLGDEWSFTVKNTSDRGGRITNVYVEHELRGDRILSRLGTTRIKNRRGVRFRFDPYRDARNQPWGLNNPASYDEFPGIDDVGWMNTAFKFRSKSRALGLDPGESFTFVMAKNADVHPPLETMDELMGTRGYRVAMEFNRRGDDRGPLLITGDELIPPGIDRISGAAEPVTQISASAETVATPAPTAVLAGVALLSLATVRRRSAR